MANATKVTKRQYFGALKALVNGEGLAYPVEDVVAFLDHEVELLNNKSANKKPTKTQEANEGLKAIVVEILTENKAPMTVTEILATKKFEDGTTNQKISALLRQLVESGAVVKAMDKKTARFSVAE